MFRKSKGQSMIEYVLLVTVLVLVMIYAANNVIRPRVTAQIDAAGNMTNTSTQRFITATR